MPISRIIYYSKQFDIFDIHLKEEKIEAVAQRCSVKMMVFLEILQNSQENTCARASFLIKLLARPATLLKMRLWHRCFPVNFAKFQRAPFLIEYLQWLLLKKYFTLQEKTVSIWMIIKQRQTLKNYYHKK